MRTAEYPAPDADPAAVSDRTCVRGARACSTSWTRATARARPGRRRGQRAARRARCSRATSPISARPGAYTETARPWSNRSRSGWSAQVLLGHGQPRRSRGVPHLAPRRTRPGRRHDRPGRRARRAARDHPRHHRAEGTTTASSRTASWNGSATRSRPLHRWARSSRCTTRLCRACCRWLPSVELLDQSRLAGVLRGTDVARDHRRAPALLDLRDLRRHPRLGRLSTCYAQDLDGAHRRHAGPRTALRRSISCTCTTTRSSTRSSRSTFRAPSSTSTRREARDRLRAAGVRPLSDAPRMRALAAGCADRADRSDPLTCTAEPVSAASAAPTGARTGNIALQRGAHGGDRGSFGHLGPAPPSLRQNMSMSRASREAAPAAAATPAGSSARMRTPGPVRGTARPVMRA